jgi:hypothetical protein
MGFKMILYFSPFRQCLSLTRSHGVIVFVGYQSSMVMHGMYMLQQDTRKHKDHGYVASSQPR